MANLTRVQFTAPKLAQRLTHWRKVRIPRHHAGQYTIPDRIPSNIMGIDLEDLPFTFQNGPCRLLRSQFNYHVPTRRIQSTPTHGSCAERHLERERLGVTGTGRNPPR